MLERGQYVHSGKTDLVIVTFGSMGDRFTQRWNLGYRKENVENKYTKETEEMVVIREVRSRREELEMQQLEEMYAIEQSNKTQGEFEEGMDYRFQLKLATGTEMYADLVNAHAQSEFFGTQDEMIQQGDAFIIFADLMSEKPQLLTPVRDLIRKISTFKEREEAFSPILVIGVHEEAQVLNTKFKNWKEVVKYSDQRLRQMIAQIGANSEFRKLGKKQDTCEILHYHSLPIDQTRYWKRPLFMVSRMYRAQLNQLKDLFELRQGSRIFEMMVGDAKMFKNINLKRFGGMVVGVTTYYFDLITDAFLAWTYYRNDLVAPAFAIIFFCVLPAIQLSVLDFLLERSWWTIFQNIAYNILHIRLLVEGYRSIKNKRKTAWWSLSRMFEVILESLPSTVIQVATIIKLFHDNHVGNGETQNSCPLPGKLSEWTKLADCLPIYLFLSFFMAIRLLVHSESEWNPLLKAQKTAEPESRGCKRLCGCPSIFKIGVILYYLSDLSTRCVAIGVFAALFANQMALWAFIFIVIFGLRVFYSYYLNRGKWDQVVLMDVFMTLIGDFPEDKRLPYRKSLHISSLLENIAFITCAVFAATPYYDTNTIILLLIVYASVLITREIIWYFVMKDWIETEKPDVPLRKRPSLFGKMMGSSFMGNKGGSSLGTFDEIRGPLAGSKSASSSRYQMASGS